MKTLSLSVFIGLVTASTVVALILNQYQPRYFQQFMFQMNPALVMMVSGVVGTFVLSNFNSRGIFVVYKRSSWPQLLRFLAVTIAFALFAIFIDIRTIFPEDMNVPFPESLLFYPVMALLVEILFHALPLFVLLSFFKFVFRDVKIQRFVWVSIVCVALIEPTYQIYFMQEFPFWAICAVWLNLFFFNLIQLIIFQKHGFLSMYLARLVYYFIWHIGWGHLRLELIF